MPLPALPKSPARLCIPPSRFASSSHHKAGFTLIELMLAVAIVAVLAVIALGSYSQYRDRIRLLQATVDIGAMSTHIGKYALDNNVYPDTLADIGQANVKDPWGNPYRYINHDDNAKKGSWRKDHNIVPINSDFDLWSDGKDGKSSPPLTATTSRDDIVRASNGRFVGLASDFDP